MSAGFRVSEGCRREALSGRAAAGGRAGGGGRTAISSSRLSSQTSRTRRVSPSGVMPVRLPSAATAWATATAWTTLNQGPAFQAGIQALRRR